jgi:hypothetical protein
MEQQKMNIVNYIPAPALRLILIVPGNFVARQIAAVPPSECPQKIN